MNSLAEHIADSVRAQAQSFVPGDQIAPCVVMWLDPEGLWEAVVPELQVLMPELFILGDYAPEKRRGPALWLRCIEARAVSAYRAHQEPGMV
jgi:hypothetical protein